MTISLLLKMLFIALAIVLIALCVDGGNQAVIQVSELTSYGSGNYTCCVYGNCTCNSLDYALANLASNVLINITTDVMLSSIIEASNLYNVTIIGHNYPIITCRIVGALHLNHCHNNIIEGITWNGCGSTMNPALKLSNSYNIIINGSSFQRSKGQALVLSEVSGNVNIAHCSFVYNSQYEVYDAVIHYSSSDAVLPSLTISNSNFSNNRCNRSIVFLESKIFKSDHGHNIIFHNCTFSYNQGTSVYAVNQQINLNGKIMFHNNMAEMGAGIDIRDYSTVKFGKNSVVKFIQNSAANVGGAVLLSNHCSVIFDQNCTAIFSGNNASKGSAIYARAKSNVTFTGTCQVTFISNSATSSGGALVCINDTKITIKDNSNVTFHGNEARQSGGAIHLHDMCSVTFSDSSSSVFSHNIAKINGGVMLCSQPCKIVFEGNSTVSFDHNTADNGGAFYFTNSTLMSRGASKLSFYNNVARQIGGVGYFSLNSKMITEADATVMFESNVAEINAGVLYCTNSHILFKGHSAIKITNNRALLKAGAFLIDSESSASFSQYTNVRFCQNIAFDGGAVLANNRSIITLTDYSVLSFVSNEATQSGGTGYFSFQCDFIMDENAVLIFDNNKAIFGGALLIEKGTKATFRANSTTSFYNNLAIKDGGAVKVLTDSSIILKDDATIKTTENNAQYGGAVFLDPTALMVNICNSNCMTFNSNLVAILGNLVYQDIDESCNSSCVADRMIGIDYEVVSTPLSELKLYKPAICIDDDNDTQCNSYYVQNIMLGSDIVIPACVLDHYNHSIESTQFVVQSKTHSDFSISGPNHILIWCDTFQGISIMSKQSLSKSTNISFTLSLNPVLYSNWKQILISFTIEISPCHPGFWQYPKSERCECYNANDIVFCSGISSTIMRGYWFGSVTGKPTVTFCPINYCNFTCCEASNGYYHLSPVRKDQCRPHRSGTACGSCADGYTLSFDSAECVSAESCTAGQTVLVILLTMTYWALMITLVFGMMHYKVGIGYLYSITYYYSIVIIILNENLQDSKGLHLIVRIMSSFSKLTPQFLGEICLTTGMSGIDQQFIHYIHPAAVVLILAAISLLARNSRRISTIIGKAIIRVICLLLLLSYASVASTSLLLMRSLTFHEIDKVYTYLSPDIEYFHGRHFAYVIVALLCVVTIVISLPLLLTVEPLLNHKINFTRFKPLLDQFQGCYKDKYRCFAGYYMLCRLVIIAIVIIHSSNHFVANYMIIVVCGITDFIHLVVKPYNKEILNKFDGFNLHLLIFIASLPLLDDFNSPLVITIAYILVVLPLINLIVLMLFLHKGNLKKISTCFESKEESQSNNMDVINNNYELPVEEFYRIVDNSTRRNSTVFAM